MTKFPVTKIYDSHDSHDDIKYLKILFKVQIKHVELMAAFSNTVIIVACFSFGEGNSCCPLRLFQTLNYHQKLNDSKFTCSFGIFLTDVKHFCLPLFA